MRASQIRRLTGLTVGILACLVIAESSEARVIEGFESGDPAVYAVGDAGPRGTYQTEASPQGIVQYLIVTDNVGIASQSGNAPISVATINGNINFNGAAPSGFSASGVFIPFTLMAGESMLTFQFDFLSNEPPQTFPSNDFGFYALFNGTSDGVSTTGSQIGSTSTFVSEASPGVAFSNFGAGSPFIAHTGYQTLTISLASLGLVVGNTYTLGIGVIDAVNNQHPSGLLLDNFQLVPEASTVAYCVGGAVLLLALGRKIRRTT